MEVFLTGATGYIGSAVAEHLQAARHHVTGLARSEEAVRKLESRNIRAHRGDLRDPDTVAAGARAAEAVIHAGLPGTPETPQIERIVVEAILASLAGTQKPFIYTSGVWVLGNTGEKVADEESPLAPPPLVAWRPAMEQMVLAARRVHGVVIRAAMVYGRGGGVLAGLLKSAREEGVVRIAGDGGNRWTWVHVDDLADLYVKLLNAPAGTLVHAASGDAMPVRQVADAIARATGARVEALPVEQARQTMGPYAEGLALDQQVSGRKAQELFGWHPTGAPVLQEIGRPAGRAAR